MQAGTHVQTSSGPDFAVPWPAIAAACLIAGLLAAMLALNWHGFRGSGGDDWQYLDAARCLRGNVLCPPETHWAARHAIVGPLAAVTALFGESHLTVGLPSLLATFVVLATVFLSMRRIAGLHAALITCLLLVLTPVFVDRAVRPNADMVELGWTVLSTGLLMLSRGTHRPLLVASGLCAGMAFGARATAFAPVALIVAGWAIAAGPHRSWRSFAAWGLAAALPLAAEATFHGVFHGSPLLRWTLELNHTAIPSTALAAEYRGAFPIFNPALIAAWPVRFGPDVHWSVNGLVNLFFSPSVALTLVVAVGSQILVRLVHVPVPRWTPLLFAGALGHFFILVYGLGIDPTPRMFLPGIALLCVAAGINIAALSARLPILTAGAILVPLFLLFLARTASVQYAAPDMMALDRAATQMIASARQPLAGGANTLRMLALNPAAQTLAHTANSRSILVFAPKGCAAQAQSMASPDTAAAVLSDTPLAKSDPPLVAWMRERRILLTPQAPAALCIIARSPRGG